MEASKCRQKGPKRERRYQSKTPDCSSPCRRPAQTRARTVLVVATSDRTAAERLKAAYTATTIAEDFRDNGLRVLLVVDSLTRFARALREIGLAAGEPPARRGFPPSVMAELPRLFGVESSFPYAVVGRAPLSRSSDGVNLDRVGRRPPTPRCFANPFLVTSGR